PGTMTLVPLRDELTGGIRPALGVLMGAVVCLLIIACANVANLMLARLARRERDLALRAALGASRSRLVRQLLVESAVLAAAGAALGVALSAIGLPVLVRLAPASMSRLAATTIDVRVLAFSSMLAMAACLIFGLIPAARASRINLQASM